MDDHRRSQDEGPKCRGSGCGGAKERGKAKGKEGGWGGWVGSSCGSSDATTATSLPLLRLLSSSSSLSLSSDTVFLFWLLSLSRRIWNEMSSNQLHFWDFSFCFSSVAVALLLCYVHALLFSLIFVAHDGSVASSSSPWSFGASFRAAGQEGEEQEVFKRPRNARAGRGIVVSGDRRWRWRILNPRRNKSWRRYPTMWRSRLTSPMVCSLCMAISGISSEASWKRRNLKRYCGFFFPCFCLPPPLRGSFPVDS